MFTRGYIWGIIMDDHNPWTGKSYWPLILSYVRNPVISMGRLWNGGLISQGVSINSMETGFAWIWWNTTKNISFSKENDNLSWKACRPNLRIQQIKESNFWAVALSSNLVVCTTANPKIHIYIYIYIYSMCFLIIIPIGSLVNETTTTANAAARRYA